MVDKKIIMEIARNDFKDFEAVIENLDDVIEEALRIVCEIETKKTYTTPEEMGEIYTYRLNFLTIYFAVIQEIFYYVKNNIPDYLQSYCWSLPTVSTIWNKERIKSVMSKPEVKEMMTTKQAINFVKSQITEKEYSDVLDKTKEMVSSELNPIISNLIVEDMIKSNPTKIYNFLNQDLKIQIHSGKLNEVIWNLANSYKDLGSLIQHTLEFKSHYLNIEGDI